MRRLGGLAAALLLVAAAVPADGPAAAAVPRRPAVERAARAGGGHDAGVRGHEGDEGLVLAGARRETVAEGSACPPKAPVRRYDVAAIDVDISLNRYLDHDPQGRMYVLASDVERVRAEEAANAAARTGGGEPAVTLGLQGDAIQPLTLRVNQGECLRLTLENRLAGEPASLHVHGSALTVVGGGGPAVAANPRATAAPGGRVEYEWWVAPDVQDGTHYFHSHGRERGQTGHGLFGAVIVEPAGSTWTDPTTGRRAPTGWAAVVDPPDRPAFREFVLYYHEIGDELYQFLDRAGSFVPLVDPILGDYRPGARALNYRSEPFMNRMALQQRTTGRFDESLAYSSYSFGDPATPILRAYLGDRVTQRVVHAGAEVFHVHHVHGGSIRWRRDHHAEDAADTSGRAGRTGLLKHPPLLPRRSERIDSQAIGPSETFDETNECGAGGCQQSAGDFLFHCHVAQHYFAGMWGIWRVYNTLQDGPASTDELPPLRELPDRRGETVAAVTSDQLVGTKVDPGTGEVEVDEAKLADLVEAQLPPSGQPKGYDAAVLDWSRDGRRYLGEPEDIRAWPGRRGAAGEGQGGAGQRRPLRFDPRTARLAYPMLKAHLGQRPPFAPNHGPAPFLDPTPNGRPPPTPGNSGPASLCPEGTTVKPVAIDALPMSVSLNARLNLVDGSGELYALRRQRRELDADPSKRVPLAIRANAGEDCVDILFRSELADDAVNHGFAKVSLHVHMVQFDVQASDGVDTGFNYEQSVRPYAAEGEHLRRPVAAGADRVEVTSTARFQPGVVVGVGMEREEGVEVRRVRAIEGDVLVLDSPLDGDHAGNEIVSTEFLRYRWYPDVQFGTAYFHDHVNALQSWRHGLFGALVAEPPGSTYHDPHTGAEVASGPVADIHTEAKVTADVTGSFREMVAFLQDDVPINTVGRSSGGALNLRAEPATGRGRDPTTLFSSASLGDPQTPVLDAMLGDPVVFRTLVGGTNDTHTWHVDGHWFRIEPFSRTAAPVTTLHVGISERVDVAVPAAGGPQRMPGDYLMADGRTFKLREGAWGILRVHGPGDAGGPRPLPGRTPPAAGKDVCPPGAPVRIFAVSAVDVPLPMLDGRPGKAFVTGPVAPGTAPEPLVLHVGVGDCVEIRLRNATTAGPVSVHADGLAYDPSSSGGVAVGREPVQAAAPGAERTYRFHAPKEVGETVALLRDGADPLRNPGLGLYGAVVVGPAGARYLDPATGADLAGTSRAQVDVVPLKGRAYRDAVLFLQDEDAGIGTHRMPYTTKVSGPAAINYQRTPFEGARPAQASTPVLQAQVGDPLRLHVLAPWSEQAQVFAVEGHDWPADPAVARSGRLSSVQLGAWEATTLRLVAGGPAGLPGDYEYGTHREPYREAGMWGRFVVAPRGAPPLRPLPGAEPAGAGDGSRRADVLVAAGVAAVFALGLVGLRARRRGRRLPEPAVGETG